MMDPNAPARAAQGNILVIDDMRLFDFEAVYARDADSAILMLGAKPEWKQVWWDWDLGTGTGEPYGKDTVEPVMRWLEERWMNVHGSTLDIGEHVIITDNPPGRLVLRLFFDRWEMPYQVRSGQVPYRIDPEWRG